jgi:FkbM family methyltransferase
MTPGLPAWCLPSAWSREGRAHVQWELKRSKADEADRQGHVFVYPHPHLGRFVYYPGDYLSRRIFLYDNFERAELQFAVDQARQGGTAIDAGANIGLYTVACATASEGRGRVVALEPGPATFAKLSETCRLLGLSNVTLLNVAAGGTNGPAFLVSAPGVDDVHQHLTDGRPHDASHLVEVQILRLDDAADPDTVTLVKVDVEGHEFEALSGAARILENGRAQLVVEFFPSALEAAGSSAAALHELLSRTHDCTAIVRSDGTVLPGIFPFDLGPKEETFNTFWTPRPVRQRDHTGTTARPSDGTAA